MKTLAKLYPQFRAKSISGVQLVSLHLLLHRPVGDADCQDKRFGPYISTLPREFSAHPLTWMVKRKLEVQDTLEGLLLGLLPPSTFRRLSALYDRFWTDWSAILHILVRCFRSSYDMNLNRSAPPDGRPDACCKLVAGGPLTHLSSRR